MNPILINIGPIEIRWYSVLILLAFIIGYLIVMKTCKKRGISKTLITDMSFNLIIFCIIGARLYYCLFEWEYYSKNILDIFKIWEGGLAIHGGIIAGILVIFFTCKKKNISMLEIMDVFAPVLILGQAIGRWGNFFNSEAYGPATTLETLKSLHIPNFIIDGMYINNSYHHPTFLYESIGCIIILLIILLYKKFSKQKTGRVSAIYFIGYGVIRFFIESLRQDSLMFFNLKIAQIVSIIMVLVGIYLMIRPYIISKKYRGKIYDK